MKTKKYDTFNAHRVNNSDPYYRKERIFLEEWEKLNNERLNVSYCRENNISGYLISDKINEPSILSDRDSKIVRTVIQWLGTPVGQGFLLNVQRKIDTEKNK